MTEKNPNSENFRWYNNEFITLNDYQHLFRNLFGSEQFGMALTDDAGKVFFCNPAFSAAVLNRVPSVILREMTHTTEGATVINPDLIEFAIHSNHEPVILSRLKFSGKPDGPSYLWLSKSTAYNLGQVQRKTTDSSSDNSFILTLHTSEDDKLLFGNKLFSQSFLIEHIDSNADVKNLFEEPSRYLALKEKLLARKEVSNETIHFKKRNGQRLTGLTNCQAHFDEHGRTFLNWSILDISTQVENERNLEIKNEQLAKVNSQMERFLYSTSHDLRSPLTSILGLVNLLKAETKERTLLEYVSKIENCTLKLDNIIKDIMSFSKTNYQRVRSVKIDLEQLIWKVINSYSIFPDFAKIYFEVKVSGDSLFYSDHDRIEIVLNNLIRNSIIFFDHHKMRPFIRVSVNIGHSEVSMEIIDNGIGIPVQHQNNVFNMFYKASDRSRGTGLGLYIVRESLQQLKGKIRLESEVGFGTVFRCCIPNDTKGMLINRKLRLKQNA